MELLIIRHGQSEADLLRCHEGRRWNDQYAIQGFSEATGYYGCKFNQWRYCGPSMGSGRGEKKGYFHGRE